MGDWKGPPLKNVFFGDFSQMWVVGVADSQTRSKPLKTPQITLKPFALPNLTKPPKNAKICNILSNLAWTGYHILTPKILYSCSYCCCCSVTEKTDVMVLAPVMVLAYVMVKQARSAKRVAKGHQLEIGAQRVPRCLVS